MKYIFIGICIGYILTCLLKPDNSFTVGGNQNFKDFAIKKLLRASSRWLVAAENDLSPLISLLHAQYGISTWWSLKDIATDSEIEKATGINVKEHEKQITGVQDVVTKRVVMECPKFAKNMNKYFVVTSGQGIAS
tara:strand:- start:1809 stop:2213 length:405 start_codon:yes stop_codon:yes gene_type:complete